MGQNSRSGLGTNACFLWFVVRRAKIAGGAPGNRRGDPGLLWTTESLAMLFAGLIRRRVASRDMWGRLYATLSD